MLEILLGANSFSEAFVQGVIKFIVLSLLFFACSAIYKSFSNKKNKKSEKDIGSKKTENEIGEVFSESNIDNIIVPEKINPNITNKKEPIELRYYNYFFAGLNKGYKRLILVGSFLLPLIFGIILYYASGEERTWDGETYIDYNNAIPVIGGFILGCLLYWIIFILIIWILKGFKEDKKIT